MAPGVDTTRGPARPDERSGNAFDPCRSCSGDGQDEGAAGRRGDCLRQDPEHDAHDGRQPGRARGLDRAQRRARADTQPAAQRADRDRHRRGERLRLLPRRAYRGQPPRRRRGKRARPQPHRRLVGSEGRGRAQVRAGREREARRRQRPGPCRGSGRRVRRCGHRGDRRPRCPERPYQLLQPSRSHGARLPRGRAGHGGSGMNRRGYSFLAVALIALAGAIAALALAAPTETKTEAAGRGTLTVRSSEYGRILFDGRGFVLYGFTADKNRRSVWFGACAAAWPPYLVKGKPRAGRGVKRSLLGTIRRPGGKRQVTYAGDRSTTTSATEDRDRSSARTCSSSAATGSSSPRTGPSFGDGNLTNREEYR